jgi:hypothetical protein
MRAGGRAVAALCVGLLSAALVGCQGGAPTAPPATAAPPATPATPSPSPLATPWAPPAPTKAAARIPAITLGSGDNYFRVDGKSSLVFSRNVAGYRLSDYKTFFDWSKAGGSSLARIQLDSMGMGYTSSGGVDESWASLWDRVLDAAAADGIDVLPVFSGWFDWNAGAGYSTWKSNPLNQANGGPVKSPAELFAHGSATQKLWLNWMQTLVKRWQGRPNILGWEVFSEVNFASGSTEAAGIDFVNSAAAQIRAADPAGRPVTASLADDGKWPNFYRDTKIDFIQTHPYPPSARLDRAIVDGVRGYIARYGRPVLIGESGLNAESPEKYPANPETGVRHAIWAGVVSGAMNGRALYWEDSFGIYFSDLGMGWMAKFAEAESPAVAFVAGVDFTGFRPLASTSTAGVWGAAVGTDSSVIGWYRDSSSEPPTWTAKPRVTGQTVTIEVPDTAAAWRVDFYDTADGTTLLGSADVSRYGGTVTVALPAFHDDIAFKLIALSPPAT